MTLETPPGSTAALTHEVAAIWQRTLNLRPPMAPDANFVALGGDSLLLMAILDEIEGMYGVEMDVDAVLVDLTVAGMARVVHEALQAKAGGVGD